MASEWNLQSPGEVVIDLGGFNGHVERRMMVLRVCMMNMELAEEMLREEDYSSFVMKRSCA